MLLTAHAATERAAVRPPAPSERTRIVTAIRDTWWYESQPLQSGYHLGLKRPRPLPRIAVSLGTFGRATRHVRVTLTIQETAGTIVRAKTVNRISGVTLSTVVFDHLSPLHAGKAVVQLDIHDAGAHPLRYPVIFTSG